MESEKYLKPCMGTKKSRHVRNASDAPPGYIPTPVCGLWFEDGDIKNGRDKQQNCNVDDSGVRINLGFNDTNSLESIFGILTVSPSKRPFGDLPPRVHSHSSVPNALKLGRKSFDTCDVAKDQQHERHLKTSPDILAQQMTLIELKYFQAIQPEEFVSMKWNSKEKLQYAPNIVASTRWFNQILFWVQKDILNEEIQSKRTEILSHFIRIAKKLVDLNNFSSAMAVVSGLHVQCIYRLSQTWASLSSKDRTTFRKLADLFAQEHNAANLRSAMDGARLPCIPYLGIYLGDLTYIDVAASAAAHHEGSSWDSQGKQDRINNILRTIANFQQSSYPFSRNEQVASYLEAQRYIEELQRFIEDANYKLSLRLEPIPPNPAVSNPAEPVTKPSLTNSIFNSIASTVLKPIPLHTSSTGPCSSYQTARLPQSPSHSTTGSLGRCHDHLFTDSLVGYKATSQTFAGRPKSAKSVTPLLDVFVPSAQHQPIGVSHEAPAGSLSRDPPATVNSNKKSKTSQQTHRRLGSWSAVGSKDVPLTNLLFDANSSKNPKSTVSLKNAVESLVSIRPNCSDDRTQQQDPITISQPSLTKRPISKSDPRRQTTQSIQSDPDSGSNRRNHATRSEAIQTPRRLMADGDASLSCSRSVPNTQALIYDQSDNTMNPQKKSTPDRTKLNKNGTSPRTSHQSRSVQSFDRSSAKDKPGTLLVQATNSRTISNGPRRPSSANPKKVVQSASNPTLDPSESLTQRDLIHLGPTHNQTTEPHQSSSASSSPFESKPRTITTPNLSHLALAALAAVQVSVGDYPYDLIGHDMVTTLGELGQSRATTPIKKSTPIGLEVPTGLNVIAEGCLLCRSCSTSVFKHANLLNQSHPGTESPDQSRPNTWTPWSPPTSTTKSHPKRHRSFLKPIKHKNKSTHQELSDPNSNLLAPSPCTSRSCSSVSSITFDLHNDGLDWESVSATSSFQPHLSSVKPRIARSEQTLMASNLFATTPKTCPIARRKSQLGQSFWSLKFVRSKPKPRWAVLIQSDHATPQTFLVLFKPHRKPGEPLNSLGDWSLVRSKVGTSPDSFSASRCQVLSVQAALFDHRGSSSMSLAQPPVLVLESQTNKPKVYQLTAPLGTSSILSEETESHVLCSSPTNLTSVTKPKLTCKKQNTSHRFWPRNWSKSARRLSETLKHKLRPIHRPSLIPFLNGSDQMSSNTLVVQPDPTKDNPIPNNWSPLLSLFPKWTQTSHL